MMKSEGIENLLIEIPPKLEKIYKEFEPLTTKFIIENLGKGEIFIDIGANIGYFSVLASRVVGEQGRVYAVEASPEVLPILSRNIESLTNISILNHVVGDHNGYTDFYLTEDYVNSGVSLNPFLNDARKIKLPIDTLDNIFSQLFLSIGQIDFIKCDVQGDEIAVLNGAKEIIGASKNLRLIIEWAPSWMKNAGYDPDDLPALLESLGFKSIVIIDDWMKKILTLKEMRAEFAKDSSGKRFCNIFASKVAL